LNNRTIEDIKRLGKATDVFYFKQFRVKDDRSTMRVGTDAVLLGAAVDMAGAGKILEIGTGCGIIALMMAQRSDAMIDAIEIDADSVQQARENIMNSPWKERIHIFHSSFQEFTRTCSKKYELIISNPPYFSKSSKSGDAKRDIGRHTDCLNFNTLINHSKELMTETGSLWVILPVNESKDFIDTATKHDLFVNYMLLFIPKEGKASNRVVMKLSKDNTDRIIQDKLTHRNTNGSFSDDYMDFMREFYIDF
jgi:tRNA1Val (adenine37-N6)-methyltransferase